MAGWCSATVKDVVGADTLVVVAAAKNPNAPPPEKRITLSSLIAPRLVRTGPWVRSFCTLPDCG